MISLLVDDILSKQPPPSPELSDSISLSDPEDQKDFDAFVTSISEIVDTKQKKTLPKIYGVVDPASKYLEFKALWDQYEKLQELSNEVERNTLIKKREKQEINKMIRTGLGKQIHAMQARYKLFENLLERVLKKDKTESERPKNMD